MADAASVLTAMEGHALLEDTDQNMPQMSL